MRNNNINGDAVRSIRERIGLTRKELAKKLNRTPAAIGNYENGARTFDIDDAWHLIDIAKKHGLTIALEDIYPPHHRLTAKH